MYRKIPIYVIVFLWVTFPGRVQYNQKLFKYKINDSLSTYPDNNMTKLFVRHVLLIFLLQNYIMNGAAAADSATATPEQQLAKLAGKATSKVVYVGVTVIDGTSAAPQSDMALVVEGERILQVMPAARLDQAATAGAEIVDMKGRFVLPGLIDSHVHYGTHPTRSFAEPQLKRDLYAGITGVRDMAGDVRFLGDLTRAALINEIAAPDIFYASLVAGPSFFEDPRTVTSSLGMPAGKAPWMFAVTDKTDMALTLAQARGTGATGLKIYANLPGTLVQRLIREAHRQHFPVWSHMQVYPATPYDSLGATSVSHVCMIARYAAQPGKEKYGHNNQPSYAGISPETPEIKKYIAALRKSSSMLDATLGVYYLSPEQLAKQADRPHCSIELAGAITHAALLAGVPILAGTDGNAEPDDAYPQLNRELEYLVQYAGLSPTQAIIAATSNAARALGKEQEMGTIAAGKLANLVFLTDNPTEAISNLHTVVLTVKRGLRFPRSDYRQHSIPDSDD